MSNAFSINVPLSQILAQVNGMEAAVVEAARPAAQAAAQVLYDEVVANVRRIRRLTGNLDRSIYQVYSRAASVGGKAVYHVSWNPRKAPHGHLVEYGHIQRYQMVKYRDGSIRPLVRPGMRGKKPPGRRASQAQKDAYYVLLPAMKQVAAQPFVRPAARKMPQAIAAAEAELLRRVNARGAVA